MVGVVFLLVWPVVVGDHTLFYRDLYRQHMGTARLLHSAELPFGLLWDPFLNGGQPLLAVGTNGYVAWSQVNPVSDNTDWYREELQLDAAGQSQQSFSLPVGIPGSVDLQGLVVQAPGSASPFLLTAAFQLGW